MGPDPYPPPRSLSCLLCRPETMSKILSKSGDSLADVYDVEGSIAGIDELQSKDVNLVHEMGATLFTERIQGRITRLVAGGLAQNVAFTEDLEPGPALSQLRLVGVQVFANQTTRLSRVQVSVSTPVPIQDFPVWMWEVGDAELVINIMTAGVLDSGRFMLMPQHTALPSLNIQNNRGETTPQLGLRGVTSGFGAGTVSVTALLYHAFPLIQGISSRGLPMPSW